MVLSCLVIKIIEDIIKHEHLIGKIGIEKWYKIIAILGGVDFLSSPIPFYTIDSLKLISWISELKRLDGFEVNIPIDELKTYVKDYLLTYSNANSKFNPLAIFKES